MLSKGPGTPKGTGFKSVLAHSQRLEEDRSPTSQVSIITPLLPLFARFPGKEVIACPSYYYNKIGRAFGRGERNQLSIVSP